MRKSGKSAKMLRRSSLFLTVLAVLLQVTVAMADNDHHSEVVPVNSSAYGKTYGEWSDAWWKWLISLPSVSNPISSISCIHTNQTQKVFFLVGVGNGTKTCTIRTGTPLFFPLINDAWLEDPAVLDPNFRPPYVPATWVKFIREAFAANRVTLSATIDRVPVKDLTKYLVSTDPKKPFAAHFLADNALGFPPVDWIGVNGGYYLLLHPLKPGTHIIEFTGSELQSSTLTIPPGLGDFSISPFSIHTTYTITVVGEKEKEDD